MNRVVSRYSFCPQIKINHYIDTLEKQRRSSSFSLWRKVHLYSFGYFKLLSVAVSIILVIISVTGILYNHHHDFDFLSKGRISTLILPDSYQDRLDETRKAQGLENLFPEESKSVPVIWLVKDLHTGDFFGRWGRLVYDLLGVMLLVLAVSGCYLYLVIQKRKNLKRKEIDK